MQASTPRADADLGRQRVVVDAFLAASRDGDFDALLAVLDPDVVLRADTGAPTGLVRGAVAVARQALLFSRLARFRRPAIVNGAIGIVTNLAARLCGEAAGGEILVSQRARVCLDSAFRVEPAGELVLKGFHRPVPAFRVLL